MSSMLAGQNSGLPPVTSREAIVALVVDDELHVRNYLRSLLEELGVIKVAEASTGQEAWERMLQSPPSVVFLDVNMPGMSGLEVMEKISQHEPLLPTVIVTSNNDLATVKRFQVLGAAGYILKNLPRRVVLTMLESSLDDLLVDGTPTSEERV